MRNWIYLIATILSTSPAYAVDTPTNNIALDQAIVKVLEHNPQLKASGFSARATAARIKQARLGTPVNMKLELQNFSGSEVYSGSDAMESTLSFATVLELGNKARLRGDVAQQEASLLQNTQDAMRLDLLAKATRRFLHVVIDQQRLVIAKDKLALMQRTLKTVSQRVKAGRSPVAERRRVVIAHARAEIELEHAQHELATSRLKLSTLWGETEPTFAKAQAVLFNLPKVEHFNALSGQLQRNPDIVRFATQSRLAEARLQVARSRGRSNVEVSAGVRHFNANDDQAFVLSASIPFGSGSRAAPYIEEAQLLSQRESFDFEQRRLELHTNLFEIYQELLHAETALDTLQQKIIPEAKRALRAYDEGYSAGRYSLLELSDAQRTLLDARLEAVMTAASYHRYQIEIERLTGATLPTIKSAGALQ